LNIEIGKRLKITHCPETVSREFKKRLTLPNPEYQSAQKRGRWTGHLKPRLFFYQVENNALIIPRGLLYQVIDFSRNHGIVPEITDQRIELPFINFNFNGRLKDLQVPAVKEILSCSQGFLKAATGAGKTVMALRIIKERKQPCLIIVPNKTLLYQWITDVEYFLTIPRDQIGIIGDGCNSIGMGVTVGIINSVAKSAGRINGLFGHLVIDEAHKAVSKTYQDAISQFGAKFILALSATPYRRDGLTKLLYFSLGDVVARVDKDELVQSGIIVEAETQWVRTKFQTDGNASTDYSRVVTELTRDTDRNNLICRTISQAGKERKSLILSDRKRHCRTLQAMLNYGYGIRAEVLVGGFSKKKVHGIMEKIHHGHCNHLIGTSQLLGEGFNLPALDALYLVVPLRFKGKLLQSIGRVLRASTGKDKALIYDFVDSGVGVFRASALARVRTYKKAGIINLKAE